MKTKRRRFHRMVQFLVSFNKWMKNELILWDESMSGETCEWKDCEFKSEHCFCKHYKSEANVKHHPERGGASDRVNALVGN